MGGRVRESYWVRKCSKARLALRGSFNTFAASMFCLLAFGKAGAERHFVASCTKRVGRLVFNDCKT